LQRRPAVTSFDDSTLREAADLMVVHDIGRLPVVARATGKLVGMVTRSDLLKAHRRRLRDIREPQPAIKFRVARGEDPVSAVRP
jgi:CBS-domain-containing membrane protein